MAYTKQYSKTTWVNNQAPAINATNLNKIEEGIDNVDSGLVEVEQNLTERMDALEDEVDALDAAKVDATGITAGYVPTADGADGWSWAAQSGSGIPTNVRQAFLTLFESAIYTETGLTDEIAIIESWAEEVTSITLNQTSVSISGSGTVQLTATTIPVGKTVTWSSSDPSVASVSNTGIVTGIGNGSTIITASSGDLTARCNVAVSGFVMYSVTNTLTNVTTSNPATATAEAQPYIAIISAIDGYSVDTVTVEMGGVDITATVYDSSTGEINIPSVSGDIEIVAVASYVPVAVTVPMLDLRDASYDGRYFASTTLEPERTYANSTISQYVSVSPGTTVSFSGMQYPGLSNLDCVFYNYAKDATISGVNIAYGSWTHTVPEGAYWMRFNMGLDETANVTYTPYEI